MRITPIEIRQKEFERSFRGYSKEDVEAYLNTLAAEWETLLAEQRQKDERIKSLEEELKQLREVEQGMYKALKNAEETGENVVSQAQQKAELNLKEAEMKAESIIKEARWQAKNIINDAEQEAKDKYKEGLAEVRELDRDYQAIVGMKENVIHDLKNFLDEIGQKTDRFAQKSYPSSPDLEKAQETGKAQNSEEHNEGEEDRQAGEDSSFFDQL